LAEEGEADRGRATDEEEEGEDIYETDLLHVDADLEGTT
jgi:hypothetical protein